MRAGANSRAVTRSVISLLLWLMLATPCRAVDLGQQVDFDIPPQKLSTALLALAQQANIQLVLKEDLADRTTAGISGRLTLGEALARVLQPAGLAYRNVGGSAITVGTPGSLDNPGGKVGGQTSQLDAPAAVAAPAGQAGPRDAGAGSGQAGAADDGRKKSVELDQVVVTGSRLPQTARDSAVPVQVYSRQQIDQSGASSVTQFLNTLPDVSVQTTVTGGTQQFSGASTVQLHGLPAGTTLVLVNGRRVESTTGAEGGNGFFDLKMIPIAAVDRIEVLPTGSSAIYGGDALGGVVNIVLKNGFKGLEADARYGATADGKYNETQYSVAAGWKSGRWSVSAIGMYSNNSELSGDERSITANANHTQAGGTDTRQPYSNPGNVCSADGKNLTGLNASCAGIPAGSTGIGLTPSDFSETAGLLNEASIYSYASYLTPGTSYGALISGSYRLNPSVELFSELLYNHVSRQEFNHPADTVISVPASNQYNPFGEAVSIDYLFTGAGRSCVCENTDYVRPLLGARGALYDKWSWEIAGWTSRDWESISNDNYAPNNAAISSALVAGTFNPFQDGPGASPAVLNALLGAIEYHYRGALDSVNGYMRGPIAELASGEVQAVVGGEYQRNALYSVVPASAEFYSFHRENDAAFAELKIPLIANHARPEAGDVLSTQLAIRYDRYSDFGSRSSPQAGMEFRPLRSVLLRAAYGSAFKPPSLEELYSPPSSFTEVIPDPLRGGQSESVLVATGGNSRLRPETGWSRTIGAVISPEFIKDLDLTLTNWNIHIRDGIFAPSAAQIANDPDTFPGRITREPPAQGDAYPVGPISSIDSTFANFGYVDEAGFDFQASWRKRTSIGEFLPSLAITETYRYAFELTPGVPAQNALSQANDSANYAPRWKGTVALNWKRGLLQLGGDGRYTGWYKDVTDLTPTPRGLGNFWYADFNGQYEVGKALIPASTFWSTAVLSFGVRNLFNKLPAYSEYLYGLYGFDPNEYDLQGRFVYAQLRVKL